jgi:hypothetical protein
MAQMTDDDSYQVHVYPKGRKVTLVFVGGCWDKYNYELTYNSFVAPLVRRYSSDWMTWGDRETIAEGYYQWTWEKRELDIKGDG